MLESAICVAGSLFSHTSAARVLPAALKLLSPSIGWFFTSATLCSRFPFFYVIVQSLLGVAASIASKKLGIGCDLARRSLYYPFLTGLAGGVVGKVLTSAGLRLNLVAVSLVLLLQLWATMGGAVMLAVFPASVMQAVEAQSMREARYRAGAKHLSENMNKTVERSVTVSINGLQLDTVIIKPAWNATSKWMLYFGGNAEFLENTLVDLSREADRYNVNLVLFNSRGVGRSNGYVSQVSDLVEDAAAVSQYVVKKEKINPRQLLLFGHSIGGGVAAQVAYRVFPEATLILDRTFSSLSDAASSFSPFTPAFTQLLFPLLIGDLNSVEAWNGLHHNRKLILYTQRDEIISYTEASIARLPQFQPKQPDAKYVLELHGIALNCHNVPINDFNERNTVVAYVKRCLGA